MKGIFSASLFIGLCTLFAWSTQSFADDILNSHINCLKQVSRLDVITCSDPDLESADKELEHDYQKMVSDLNDDQTKIAATEEQGFLDLRKQCATNDSSLPPSPTDDEKNCLMNLYQQRFAQLQTWPKDDPQSLTINSRNESVSLQLYFNRSTFTYHADIKLLDDAGRTLNKGSFNGCTEDGLIMNLADHLQKQNELRFIALAQGFVINNLSNCGTPHTWQMFVITPVCTALTPSTDENDNPTDIGNMAGRLNFAYLMKSANGYLSIPSFLNMDDSGKLTYKLPDDLKAKGIAPVPDINC